MSSSRRLASPLAALLGALALGCDPAPPEGLDAAAPRDASALAPPPRGDREGPDPSLEAGAPVVAEPGPTLDGGAAPDPLRPASPIPVDEPSGQREASGVTLDAVFRLRDLPAPPKAPEVNLEGIREAQKLTALTLKIDLTDTGRMRAELTSRAFPLPSHAEIRSRSDRYGHLVLWPGPNQYRVIPPGALRAMLGERRADVSPLATGSVAPKGNGKLLGLATRNVEVSTPFGSVKLELGKVAEAGEGGLLLCRMLVELAGADPKSPACEAGEVPLRAAFGWAGGGGITFEVTALTRRTDLVPAALLVPPPGAGFVPTGLPAVPQGIFLTREEAAAIRGGALTLPPNKDPGAPGEGFVAQNLADREMYLLVDGIPVVAVPGGSDRYVIGPPKGRYVVQWRTFLGEKIAAPETVTFPARLTYGAAPDAGAPDAGP